MDDASVGARIREAREALGLGQELLAERVGVPRTALSAIENGKRQVTAPELLRFSEKLGRPLDFFLRPLEPKAFDFQPLLRVSPSAKPEPPRRGRPPKNAQVAIRETLVRFEELCRMYLELEELNDLPIDPLPRFDLDVGRFMHRDAERLAELIRTRLGLGPTLPATQLRDLLEERLSVKTFVLRGSGKLSGACIYHERVGGCALVVANALPHMLFTLAHELAHLLVHRDTPTVDESLLLESPREQFANAFAAALLMPRAGVQELFWSIYRSRSEVTDVDVIHMARNFGASFNAMLSRLQGLRLIVPATAESLLAAHRAAHTESGRRAEKAAASEATQKPWFPLPERYVFLAVRAYRREELSIGRLAEILCQPDGRPRSIEEAQDFVDRYQALGEGDDLPSGDEACGDEQA
jgi:Zn-dependent peptidase ImmA (M78 family)/DNA-binding XRE family transcriptional regulator